MTENITPQPPTGGGHDVPHNPLPGLPTAPVGPTATPIPAAPPGTSPHNGPPTASATAQYPAGAFDQTGWQPPTSAEQEPAGGWQQAYHKARNRSQIFMATTALAGVLALAMGAWGIAQAVTSDSGSRLASQSGTFSGPGGGQLGGPGGMGDGGRGDGGGLGLGGGMAQGGTSRGPLGQLFNSDGSLNQTAVEDFKAHLTQDPEDAAFLSQMLSRAVTAGALTQAQADSLLAALGVTTSSAATPAPTTSPSATPSATKAATSA